MKIRQLPWGTAGAFAADQIMKSYAEQNMEKNEERTLTDRIVLRRVHNRGMCLNILSDRPRIVRGLSAAAAGVVTVMYASACVRKKGICRRAGLSLLTAGAWSNTFDRLARGYVVDYIGFQTKNEKISGITYNLGDFFIAAGSALLVISELRKKQ
ncbi:signal peptidase II [Ruminococcus sp. CLA-AA-H200]|uniref:Signal peptidase II n=1 Tax=Ruminococcus turbiniformis TaxID=2881258 RepID=A0ABS8FWE5_9FIRM|nr:signal peptidase II [Ruminococcus turbiniformis]MCC2254351.1 signal peptidase II [Ruminococcus turbiniformis]